jgi:hypothetical protein
MLKNLKVGKKFVNENPLTRNFFYHRPNLGKSEAWGSQNTHDARSVQVPHYDLGESANNGKEMIKIPRDLSLCFLRSTVLPLVPRFDRKRCIPRDCCHPTDRLHGPHQCSPQLRRLHRLASRQRSQSTTRGSMNQSRKCVTSAQRTDRPGCPRGCSG